MPWDENVLCVRGLADLSSRRGKLSFEQCPPYTLIYTPANQCPPNPLALWPIQLLEGRGEALQALP